MDDFLTVNSPGAIISFTGTSASVAIPPTGNVAPRFVRLVATQPCYVRLGVGAGTTAVSGDLMIQPADAVVLRVIGGPTYIAAIQVSTGGVLQISPLDDC